MNVFFRFIQLLYVLFMILFLSGGVAIVAVQSLGIITLDANIVTGTDDWLSPVTFTCATLCAICAFILNYRPKEKAQEGNLEA